MSFKQFIKNDKRRRKKKKVRTVSTDRFYPKSYTGDKNYINTPDYGYGAQTTGSFTDSFPT